MISILTKLKKSEKNRVTLRFPQIDPAGIMFYPRYFEIALRRFPVLPFSAPPYTLTTQFIRPNRLGDTLDLSLQHDIELSSWLVTGLLQDEEHFSIRLLKDGADLTDDAHFPSLPAFTSDESEIGEWAVGYDSRMILSRYYELLNMTIEEWFEDTLEIPFFELHYGRNIAIPTVQFDTIIRGFPSIGRRATVWLRPITIGKRAMTFKSWLVVDDQCLVENKQVIVFVKTHDDGYEAIQIPGYIRERFEKQLENTGKGK